MRVGIYPGSFDPMTLGHLDIIQRASGLFDKVIVCVMNNSMKKTPLFSADERVKMLQSVVKNMDNVEVESFDGLLIDFAHSKDTNIIVRGLRELTDFDSELLMAQANRRVGGDVETVFLVTDPRYSFISSTMVREFASYGKSVEDFVPTEIAKLIDEKMHSRRNQ